MPTDSTSYFLYRGEPLGVEFEILEGFAEEHDLRLEIHRIQGREARLAALAVGGVDIAGGRLTAATADHPSLRFSTPIAQVQPTAVQANPDEPLVPEDLDGLPEFSVQSLDLDVKALTSADTTLESEPHVRMVALFGEVPEFVTSGFV